METTIGDLEKAVEAAQKLIGQLKSKGMSNKDIASLFVGSSMGILIEDHELDNAEKVALEMVTNNATIRRENKLEL